LPGENGEQGGDWIQLYNFLVRWKDYNDIYTDQKWPTKLPGATELRTQQHHNKQNNRERETMKRSSQEMRNFYTYDSSQPEKN
jgi:hypothetical protein